MARPAAPPTCWEVPRWSAATQGAWMGYCHRYLMGSTALYLDLRNDGGLTADLNSVTGAGGGAIGPQNISGARCWN